MLPWGHRQNLHHPFAPEPPSLGCSAVVPRTSRPELHMLAVASSSNAQGFAVTERCGSGSLNGIWEMEKPRAHGVEVCEQKAVQLALTAFPALAVRQMWCPEASTSPPDCQCLEIRLLVGQAGLSITRSPSGMGRAPRAAQAPSPRGKHPGGIYLTRIESFSLGKGDLSPSSFPVPPQEEHEASKLTASFIKLLFSSPKNRNAPGAPQRPCKQREGREPCGTGATAAGTPARALSRPPRALSRPPRWLFAGRCESPGREEESFVCAPGRRHVPAHCINIYSPHSYLLFDISHGPRPPRPPLGH